MSRTSPTTSPLCSSSAGREAASLAWRTPWWLGLLLLAGLSTHAACSGEVSGTERNVNAAEDEDDESDDDEDDAPKRDAGKKSDAGKKADGGDETATRRNDASTPTRTMTASDAGRANDAAAKPDAGDALAVAGDCPDGSERPLAAGLRIREIALYQTVKVSVFKDGAWVAQRPVPVVAGKKTLVRVFVDPATSYARRPLRGALTLQNGTTRKVLADERTITASSTDDLEPSTFTFTVDPADITAATELSVALEEPACDAAATTAEGARFPASGMQALTATTIGKLRVVVVPITMGGRLPLTTEAEIANVRAALLAYYPVPDVEITVRERPLAWNNSLAGTDSNGWSGLLNQVMRERSTDRPESDVYYFGLVQPAATMAAYCGRGCIMGIAPQTIRVSASQQVGLGASFGNAQTYETIVHEVGHAHGRGHAPCAQGGSIQGVDSQFPDRTGGIGTYGWDNRTAKLVKPTAKDIMGYCQPNWISGYTYAGLATRALAVNRRAFVFTPENATRWKPVLLQADGSAQWSGIIETELPGGELEPAQALDASGNVVAEIEVSRVPLSHAEAAFVYLPEPGASWSAVRLRDRVLTLSEIAPPL